MLYDNIELMLYDNIELMLYDNIELMLYDNIELMLYDNIELMLYDNKEREEAVNTLLVETDKPKRKRTKPKLAFGYGYDPEILRGGIKNYTYSHQLEDGTKLYEFEPQLPYRIFKYLAEEINFSFKGSELNLPDSILYQLRIMFIIQ